jgi:hypothetical protein
MKLLIKSHLRLIKKIVNIQQCSYLADEEMFFLISLTASSTLDDLRLLIITLAPSSANRRAIANPILKIIFITNSD